MNCVPTIKKNTYVIKWQLIIIIYQKTNVL